MTSAESTAEPQRATAARQGAVLVAQGLVKRYGAVRALDGLDLVLGRGITGLLGPNGAGKTTLIQHVLGLVRADEGTLTVLGLDPAQTAQRLRLRAAVGYMPEGDCLIPGNNAVETCTDLARLSGLTRTDARSRAHEVLDYVGFEEARYRPTVQYSTGMKQRLKLAQALVHDPELLLLDEPTNGLDPHGRRHMLELVADLGRARGKDIVLCSHLLADIERTCDEVAVLNRGRALAQGTIAALTRDEQRSLRIETEADAAPLAAALRAAGRSVHEEGPDRLCVDHASPDLDPIFAIAAAARVPLRAASPVRSTLEQVFLRALREAGEGER